MGDISQDLLICNILQGNNFVSEIQVIMNYSSRLSKNVLLLI